ncbi:endo-beta-1,4-mannanase [Colletotrichum plurivorum]|uniref:Mannan endo-1,4-beta-mannosidase A n=1 Tax=Colletotrichum plurivorum TaxID=2175906 RepID=A0A8H6JIK3_9PEZI|nr:endo-beta-1,4-mannanase [Colletotrichum plurivorum]
MQVPQALLALLSSLACVQSLVVPEARQAGTFPSASGTRFTIDGQTKYFAGSNSYWISFLTNNADVDLVMDNVAKSGLKIFRVWGFNDVNSVPGDNQVWYQYLSASGSRINTGANGLQRLDAVVAAAERKGVKLIINFVNFWDDYGGLSAYVKAFGGSKESWYTNTAAQAQYQAYIRAVVSRYQRSPAIFAWELANEPRCKGCSTDVIYKWAETTSKFVKSLDSNHMVTLGDEGMGLPGDGSYPYQYGEGTDFVKNLGIKTLDFGTFHMYPGHWGVDLRTWSPGWIKSHGDACAKAGKPCLFEEYGSLSDHCAIEKAWQQVSRTAQGLGGDLFWQWGDRLSSGQTHDDGFTIYHGSSDHQCLVVDHVKAINS